MPQKKMTSLEKKLEYRFKDKDLLKKALTHKTYAFESMDGVEYNERLEFLGDSILNFVIADMLYQKNMFFSEGELTRRRAMFVNNSFLAEKAKDLHVGKYLLLGKGETKQNGHETPSNLANTLEAIFGAIYLDSDFETVRKIITKLIVE
jgi:ribonuclease III